MNVFDEEASYNFKFNGALMYEKIYKAIKNSLRVDTINYRDIAANKQLAAIVTALCPNKDIGIDNIEEYGIRIYTVPFPEQKSVLVFVSGVPNQNAFVSTNVGGKQYIVIYRDINNLHYDQIIGYIYDEIRMMIHCLFAITPYYAARAVPDLIHYSNDNKFDELLEDEDFALPMIGLAVQLSAPIVITCKLFTINNAVSLEEINDIFMNMVEKDSEILKNLIYSILSYSYEHSIKELLDEGLIMLIFREELKDFI